MDATGLIVLLAALAVTATVAWWLRARSGAVRAGGKGEDGMDETAVLSGLGVRPAEADLTVVQFSTAFCGPCRATRARLQQLQRTRPGLAYVHVDAESHLEEVRALDVRRTPTLFYLDRAGRLLGRSSGAPRPEELTALVEAHTGIRE
ncbi:thioredoxin family protein [Blastococcus sp. TF02A-26]|uniref:TlpA family protein disulfide reductase n=1 Tax=Blastococcus sp. TF02A-26 TaxID=2250577 RepID=UPI001F29DC83|nr:thioredoxin family protein [Blastococcus sp. TF02A-26]